MDRGIFQQWREGDPMATAAVRNQLRELAEPIVSVAPGDAETRRGVTADVAREVMQREPATVQELQALTVMVGARHVVTAQRAVRPPTGDAHLPPQLVVSMAVAEDSLGDAARESARAHIAACRSCGDELRLVRRLVKLSSSSQVPGIEDAPAEHHPAPEPAPPPRATPVVARGEPDPAPAAAPPPAVRRRRDASGPIRAPRGGRLDASATVPWWRAMWPVLAIVAVAAGLVFARGQGSLARARSAEVAAIADRTPPAAPLPEALPWEARGAVADLGNGDCASAAPRFHLAHVQVPDEPETALWEAAAWVCAGDGEKAQRALDWHRQAAGPIDSAQVQWIQAQTLLLRGQRSEARAALVALRARDIERAPQIEAQLAALSAL